MTASHEDHIASLPIESKRSLFYFHDLDLLSLDEEDPKAKSANHDSFGEILWSFFLGTRKLMAIKSALNRPEVLFVEPYKTCNLACKYCYAGAGPYSKESLDSSVVERLLSLNSFDRVLVFGGDPLVDKAFLANLHKMRPWSSFFFSSNGLLADQALLEGLVANPNVNAQISLEPEAWNKRVTIGGVKQINVLYPKLKLFADSKKFQFRVTIPHDAPYVALREFLDYLAEGIGTYRFRVTYWPEKGTDLPPWIDRWIAESYAILNADKEGKYKDKLVSEHVMFHIFQKFDDPLRYFNCNAAYASVAVSPNGLLHACHENAINDITDDIVSLQDEMCEINQEKKLALTYEWANNMNSALCSACSARFICGGICFIQEAGNSGCKFEAKMLPLALAEMTVNQPLNAMRIMAVMEERFERLYAMKSRLEKEVSSQKWKQLVSGELRLQEAVELAKRLP